MQFPQVILVLRRDIHKFVGMKKITFTLALFAVIGYIHNHHF